jgi:hypothetical protein
VGVLHAENGELNTESIGALDKHSQTALLGMLLSWFEVDDGIIPLLVLATVAVFVRKKQLALGSLFSVSTMR